MRKLKETIIDLWEGFKHSGCLGYIIIMAILLFLAHSCSLQEEKKYDEIYQSAYEEGYSEGYHDGNQDGKYSGYYSGYENGYEDGKYNRWYNDNPPYK